MPAIVAEGAPKPELILNTNPVIAPAQKLACHTATSWESLTDSDVFTEYLQVEIMRQVVDVENAELLSGAGTTGHLTVYCRQAESSTHATGSDSGLDLVELSIAPLRTGPALAEADLLPLHPNTWSALRRSKDTQGRYLVTGDPTAGAAKTIWGV